ncbi:MAG: hypothetical protein IJ370_09035 [Oscillospiraceae bacterium]|nr:hypothetical protein [Oscillospiraceae bacterium]
MIEQDTIKLLRECDAGIKMGVASIEDVIDDVKSEDFKKMLEKSIGHHQQLQDEIQILLDEYHDDGKNPNPIAKGMSYVKTNLKMAVDPSDSTIADLMTDGCNMGIKSLTKYLNEYEAADKKSKDLAKKVIGLEESLAQDMKEYL